MPVKIGLPAALTDNKLKIDNAVKFDAVWDTGATIGAISQKVVDILGLKPTGATFVQGVHSQNKVNTYTVSVYLYPLEKELVAQNIEVTGGLFGDVDVLIGMDIIQQGDFFIANGNGKTVVSFCYPSLTHAINLAEQSELANKIILENLNKNV
ncbi:retropepsin-like super family [Candidatus Termititenax persephonae]|uniref:Retropepsin-like super family n=1 Tax=Candidatus Termititenax persephonae TaxID=2218525 RepID=A0A388TIC3_9BACT|nr:retropepsin-like super family [Candidatus Termititenax persephonae]